MASPFRKAKVEQAAIKMALYGPQGSGKTFTALLCAEGLAQLMNKRVAFLDTEHGTDFYSADTRAAEQPRSVHPQAFDFDVLHTRTLTDAIRSIEWLKTSDEYGVVIVDSITHLWQSAQLAYSGKETSQGTLPFHAWAKIKKPYKKLIDALMSSTLHMFLCGREKNVFKTDAETGQTEHVGVAMRAEGETPYEPHICINMRVEQPPRLQGKLAQRAVYVAFAEKDRTGVLAGRCFENPGYSELIRPIMPLLTGEQAHIADEDERRIADSEAREDAESEERATSTDTTREYRGRFMAAKSLAEVEEIGAELTKDKGAKKKLLTKSDLNVVREAYLEAKDRTAKLETATEPKPKPEKRKADPQPLDEPEHVVQHPAKFAPSVPPPDTEFFDTLKAQYNSMTPEQLGPIRIEKNFGMIDEYKTRSWEDQNDLMMAMREAAKD